VRPLVSHMRPVKLESNQVEVVEVSGTTENCANQKGAVLRLIGTSAHFV